MRRKDREITDYNKMIEIMQNCDCCRLGFQDEEGVYILPLNFGIKEDNENIILYFHGAAEGKKIDLVKSQKHIGFEMDAKHGLVEHETACGHSFLYQSIIGSGEVSLVEDIDEKINAMQCIMKHYSSKREWNFTEEMVKRVAVIKLVVTKWTCKEH
ncbi:MAG: pyridoxamine 5'-phosphate oxidase family protein [Clostridium sp.]|nr:pyridoxamine 5'-phosphate oxidase family protein [Clostridium sp.]